MYIRTLPQFGFTVLAVGMWAWPAVALGDELAWIPNPWFSEQSFTGAEVPDVRIHVNAPVIDGNANSRATRLIIYALPNGNTIEQTLGSRLAEGTDWHYDIQHIAAQVRLLRTLQPGDPIVLICAEAGGLSWPNWRRAQPNANAAISRMMESWRRRFGTDDCKVTLAGHSGGGSFVFGVVEAAEKIPVYIDRIAFLDANYAFEANLHTEKFAHWLQQDTSNRLIALAYDDRAIMLNGKKVVGPTGGTFRATERMREALSRAFALQSVEKPPFHETIGLAGQIHFYVHANRENKILHTALVGDMNGLVHVQALGTALESKWGTFGGPRAYEEWVQPEPTPTSVASQSSATGSASSGEKELKLQLPPRANNAVGGTEFVESVASANLDDREAAVLREITSGNFPEFLRQLKAVPIRGKLRDRDDGVEREIDASLQVMPDYLSVGSDADFVRMPMTPQTAQQIADRFGCLLPTRKMVDAIDEQAKVHLAPHSLTKDREAVATFLEHHRIIEQQRAGKPRGLLTIGIKKDIVLSPRIFERPQRLALYGWRQLDGKPIQPLTIVHGNRYVDYSHGARLVLNAIEIDGQQMKITDLLSDPNRCGLVSDEGPMDPPVYPAN